MRKPTNTTEAVNNNPAGFLGMAMAMGSSEAIEFMESRGQQEAVNSDTLPSRLYDNAKEVLEAAGVKFLGKVDGDELFQYVQLPEGWNKKATDHSMWNELVDNKGRVRATFFYKGAFYDRDAFLNVSRRYSVKFDYEASRTGTANVAHVYDGTEVIFTTENVDASGMESWEVSDAARDKAAAWLNEHFPKWQDPSQYWD